MLISELIARLQELKDKFGDLPVHEAEYGMPIQGPTFEKEWRQTRGCPEGKDLKNVIVL